MISEAAKSQYMCTLLHEKALRDFETHSGQIGHTTNANFNRIVLGVGTHSFPINALYKQKCEMCRRIGNPYKLKARRYLVNMIKLDEYLDFLFKILSKNW